MNSNIQHQYDMFPHLKPNSIDQKTAANAVRFYSNHLFRIPDPIVSEYYKQYYLVYWRGEFIIDQSLEYAPATIKRAGTLYQIVYKAPLTRGKILARLQDQFALSFRESLPEFNVPPVVMISFGSKSDRILSNHV